MADLRKQQSSLPPWTIVEAFQHGSITYTCILAFAAEGNNAPDAMQVADAVNQYLHLLISQQPQLHGQGHASKGVMSLPSPWLASVLKMCVWSCKLKRVVLTHVPVQGSIFAV